MDNVLNLKLTHKPVVNAAKMVLNEITMAANGSTIVTSYVIPCAISVEKLFEIYIRSYLKMAGIRSFNSHDSGIQLLPYDDKTPVLTEGNKAYAHYIRGNVKPDIILHNPQMVNMRCLMLSTKIHRIPDSLFLTECRCWRMA